MLSKVKYEILDALHILFIHLENVISSARRMLGKLSDLCMDKKYGIDTQAIADTTYIPIAEKVFNRIMKNINLKEDICFFDYGSGKGKALILASEHGICTIGGIEYDEELVNACNQNLERYKEISNTSAHFNVVYGDATKYKEIDEYNLFFVNNSFGGNPSEERLVAKLLKNIEDSLERNKRHINIVYVHPGISLQKLFDTYGWLKERSVIQNTYRPKTDKAYIYIFSIE